MFRVCEPTLTFITPDESDCPIDTSCNVTNLSNCGGWFTFSITELDDMLYFVEEEMEENIQEDKCTSENKIVLND